MNQLLEQYKPSQGIYVHIPHCLQKCHYCDFPTVLLDDGPDLDIYTDLILKELDLKLLQPNPLTSIYFGGGTPSLMGPKRIQKILNHIKNLDYDFQNTCEITIEINPGTLTLDQILELKFSGVNRFSVGVQTFNESNLKIIGREHSAQESLKTLTLLQDAKVEFTADLILALPNESFKDFQKSFETLKKFDPHHLSVYLLTVPEKSFLTQHMPKEDLLDELMNETEAYLLSQGYERYEISNYRKKNHKPSLHNLLYWNDLEYWGVGLGAHSYLKPNLTLSQNSKLKSESLWGSRFWNPRIFSKYENQILSRSQNSPWPPSNQIEHLQLNESLTDFCFTHLRQWEGLSLEVLNAKYPVQITKLVHEKLQNLRNNGYIETKENQWQLSKLGRKFADHVFRELCFSKNEVEDINDK